MRIVLTMAAIAGLATAATATPTTHHRRADTGSAAVRELNEKSLQQASAGAPMTPAAPAMSDSGAAAPAPATEPATPPAVPMDAPAAPTAPQ